TPASAAAHGGMGPPWGAPALCARQLRQDPGGQLVLCPAGGDFRVRKGQDQRADVQGQEGKGQAGTGFAGFSDLRLRLRSPQRTAGDQPGGGRGGPADLFLVLGSTPWI